MKVSLNLAQYYAGELDIKSIPLNVMLDKIGTQLGAVEEVTLWGQRYEGIVVAKIVSCEKHPDADKLNICMIDDGGVTQGVERGDDGLVQVVCGAPNARVGLSVAWLPPKVVVPATIDKDPFTLDVREIRGVKSSGMLGSPAELGLGDNHDGILEIDVNEVGDELIKPGTAFKQLYGLDDVVIAIENKMFTHRPDCFGNLGVARELAGINGLSFKSPDWYLNPPKLEGATGLGLSVDNKIPDLVPRFMVVAMKNISVKPSPIWLQSTLVRLGMKPINNVVDITNFVMHLTGQPLHAFDYDKLCMYSNSPSLMPRMSIKGEKIVLLGNKQIELSGEEIVIATDKQAVALAGVMGGAETEVDNNTKNIVIEAGTFNMYSIRRTAMRHGLFTDAVTRFNKGQSPLQNNAALAYAVKNMAELAGAEVASDMFDLKGSIDAASSVDVGLDFINSRLGSAISLDQAKNLLTSVEFTVKQQADDLQVFPPFWRTDIQIGEDIVEEIGRLYGYDKLPQTLPTRSIKPVSKNSSLDLKQNIRTKLSAAGANEVLTYSFVNRELLQKAGQDESLAFQLSNAISPDLQCYRLSLTPSLLDKVNQNIRSDMVRNEDKELAIFEIGRVHVKGKMDSDEPSLPKELNSLALVIAADAKTAERKHSGSAYYLAKKYLTWLMDSFGVEQQCSFELLEGANLKKDVLVEQMAKPYEPKRSAVIRDSKGTIWGVVGEYRDGVRRSLKLPEFSAGFEVGPGLFLDTNKARYTDPPKYPKTRADVTFKVPVDLAYDALFGFVWQQVEINMPANGFARLRPVAIYQSDKDKSTKNITFRLWLAASDHTLSIDKVNQLIDLVSVETASKFGAKRI
jgi:phenylalanyl-tRNA synthetase beta chain